MPSYLTQYPKEMQWNLHDRRLGEPFLARFAGPRIEAVSWDEAARKLLVLIEFGMVHPETEVIGELEWEGYYEGGTSGNKYDR